MFRSFLVPILLLALAATVSMAQQPTTKTLYVTLTTLSDQPMRILGMPAMPQMPGMPTGAPSRSVGARALYAQDAVEPIYLTVPADLKLPNNRLVLHLPKAEVAGPGQGGQDEDGGKSPNIEMINKLYWHPDQAKGPKTETFKIKGGQQAGMPGMSMPDMTKIIEEMNRKEATGTASDLPMAATGKGEYVCNTGGTAVLDGFLGAITVTAPDMTRLQPDQGVLVKWNAVPGVRGYLVSAMGMIMDDADDDNMKMTSISWFSTLNEPPMRIRGGYVQETTIADDLRDGVLMPGTTTQCMIPPGVFNDVMMLMIRVEAIGNDFYSHENNTTVFGTIRSEWRASGMIMPAGEGDEE